MNRVFRCPLLLIVLAGALPGQQLFPEARELRIKQLVEALHQQSWPGAENDCNSGCWQFHFSEPMKLLLEIGAPAQGALLERLSDYAIQDQIIIVLGGVGDEHAVGPIIEAMTMATSDPIAARRDRVLRAGNLALTNITVADVIWHHGGGIAVDACPVDPAGCWSKWWQARAATFRVTDITQSRKYSNYPDYGIYRGLP